MSDKFHAPGVPAFNLTARDKEVLSQTDEEYHLQTWDDLKTIIANNALAELTRLPSDLRRYLAWSAGTKAKYGNMTNFLIKERLRWAPLPSSDQDAGPAFEVENPIPFASTNDYKVLLNDWPYGLAPDIQHICVWLKGRLPVDNIDGDLTDKGREMVQHFVNERFVKMVGADRVLWFKNWARLQSVRGVEHFHVLLRDVNREQLATLTE
ncbi:hypothetical protein E2P81_ATG02911 [Venturia nashicola]|uniref:N-acetylglucosamine-induced protein 1 n=1 Tax=Venturia nashicola TaxID=86259 RepID=A0A4Z1P6F5_9PEZI|nr:hypothetical protein E6O75_ATG02974 [Venturia nashicola]TLD36022.1 hypothetical protein E2P81_ATG02911 [Venturia nashicola]